MEFIEIHWSTANLDEARRICRTLIKEQIAAQAKIIPWVESVSLLNGHVDTMQESRVLLIAKISDFKKIKEFIEESSGYAIPEITYLKLEGLNESYANWIDETLKINNL